MAEIGYIYKITNPKGKIYIGQAFNIKKRISRYKHLNCKFQPKLYNSLAKYGFANHKIEVIKECNMEMLNQFERYYQEFYDSVEKGMNCIYTKTTDKERKVSVETREKMRLAAIGRKASDEHRKKISESNKGKKHTDETRIKMRGRKVLEKTRVLLSLSKSKILIDVNTGVFYNSVNEAADIYGIKRTTLCAMLSGQNKNKTSLAYA